MPQAVCYNCFRYIPESGPCPYCGYDPKRDEGKYRIALRPGTPLANRYVIGRVLGQGGFGVTYVALDSQTRARVAIKEYLPTEFVSRDFGSVALELISEDRQADFDYGKQQFLAEARTLAEFVGNEHIVSIHSYFEENGTAYFAMEFMEGVNLKQYMEHNGGPLPVHEANRILLPIMEALDWVHSKGIVHRDISPDNIMIKRDGTAKLIDFGAARYSTGEKSKSLDVVLKHGFAPKEQYSRRGRQGPFTDVYAMAATYYYATTGKVPPDAIDRMDDDVLAAPSTLGVKIRKSTEQVLLKALAINAPDRYQRMSEFYSALLETMPLPFSPEAGEENRAKERQEMAYREACRLMETSKTEAEYRAVIRQFEKLQGYKDSRDRITQCGEAVTAIREEQRRQKEEKAKRRAEEKEKKRPAKGNTQAEKQENDSSSPKKKGPVAAVAVLLAAAILLGIVFGSGVLKKTNTVVSEPTAQPAVQSEEAETTTAEPEPEKTTEPEPEEETLLAGDFYTVGSIVTFGSYEQDNDITNGKEPIEWIVLNVQDGRSFLVSRYALDCRPYNTDDRLGVTWETCSLRTWLNDSFLNEAFSAEERAGIPMITVNADQPFDDNNPYHQNTDQGNATNDRIFLLSRTETRGYFNTDEDRLCRATAYAKENGAYTNPEGCCGWWTRSIYGNRDDKSTAILITAGGWNGVIGERVSAASDAVRPALWVNPMVLAYSTVGNVVTFGSYEQDGDEENGKEPLEWIVLDVKDGSSLLISRYGLKNNRKTRGYYHNVGYDDRYNTAVTWEICSLRKWLNDDFLKYTFDSEEQSAILTTDVDNSAEQGNSSWNTDGGRNTKDRVFLLSCSEAERYFPTDEERTCRSAYDVFHPEKFETETDTQKEFSKGNCLWWLRSPGATQTTAAYVFYDGSVEFAAAGNSQHAVRPVIRIDLDKLPA